MTSSPQQWFNPVVELFGGRSGWLGRFYVPSLQEQADERHRQLERRHFQLEDEQARKAGDNRALERRIKRMWKDGRKPEARQAVKDLRRGRVEYARIGRQKANVAAVKGKIDQLRHGTATEDALEFYVVSMADRMASTHPERFARVLERCSRLQGLQEMTDDMIDEFFADEEEAERHRDADDDVDEESAVNEVLVELGLVRGIDSAPTLKEVASIGASTDKNDDGRGSGGGGSSSGPPIRVEDDEKPMQVAVALTADFPCMKK